MKIELPVKILIGTTNQGKIKELGGLLSVLPVRLVGLNEVGTDAEIEENGSTFEENASLKAAAYARQTGLFALADDSGLEVAALGNAPGVYSARYGGENMPFSEKIKVLLAQIDRVSDMNRAARFVCVMSLADPTGQILTVAEGICRGVIAREPRGKGGFGYDPIFIPEDFDLTFGELDGDIKQQISHRARAAAKIIRYLQGFSEV